MKPFELNKVIINEEGKESEAANFIIFSSYNLVNIFDCIKQEIDKLEGHEAFKLDYNTAFCGRLELKPLIIKNKEDLSNAIRLFWETAKHMQITRVASISPYTGDDHIIRVDVFDPDETMDSSYIGLVDDTVKEYFEDEDPLVGTAIKIDEWINGAYIIRSYIYYPEEVFDIDCELENLDDYCMTTGTKYRE